MKYTMSSPAFSVAPVISSVYRNILCVHFSFQHASGNCCIVLSHVDDGKTDTCALNDRSVSRKHGKSV